nr:hypothetical protein [Tanacetum cinerariifolium]GEY80347.1 hypothetical protein [Tanacetum cinerariifolium]
SDSDVGDDTNSSSEFLADLNAQFHDRALLANQKRFYKRSGRVCLAKKPMDKCNETCFACGKQGHFQKELSKNKSEKGLVAESFDCDEESVSSEYKGVTRVKAFIVIAEDELVVGKTDARSGGRGKMKETISLKEIVFTKGENSPSKTLPDITSDTKSVDDNQNKSIVVKRHGKTTYDVSRGRSLDISYYYMFGCHMDHLGKFDKKADDGFFLGYSSVAKAFRVFNIRRQEMEETYHVTFNEADEVITQTSTEGVEINFNKNKSFPDDEFLIPRINPSQSTRIDDYHLYVPAFDPFYTNNITIPDFIYLMCYKRFKFIETSFNRLID